MTVRPLQCAFFEKVSSRDDHDAKLKARRKEKTGFGESSQKKSATLLSEDAHRCTLDFQCLCADPNRVLQYPGSVSCSARRLVVHAGQCKCGRLAQHSTSLPNTRPTRLWRPPASSIVRKPLETRWPTQHSAALPRNGCTSFRLVLPTRQILCSTLLHHPHHRSPQHHFACNVENVRLASIPSGFSCTGAEPAASAALASKHLGDYLLAQSILHCSLSLQA